MKVTDTVTSIGGTAATDWYPRTTRTLVADGKETYLIHGVREYSVGPERYTVSFEGTVLGEAWSWRGVCVIIKNSRDARKQVE